MLNENKIVEILAKYLEKQGYVIKQQLNSKQKGVDLIVENNAGILTYIEVKGETSGRENSKRYGEPFSGKQIWNHVSVGLLKTLTLMNEHEDKSVLFAIAFPMNHEKLINRIKTYTNKLGIIIYLVSMDEVKVCR